MEPYLFPECLICQVHAFGYPLRRGSLFCICLAIPVTAAVPGLLCTLTYSCPTGCSETDWHPWASEGSWALPLLSQIQLTGNSHSRWAVEIKPLGTWQLLWAAYCEIQRSSIGSRPNWCSEPHLPYMNSVGEGFAHDSLLLCQGFWSIFRGYRQEHWVKYILHQLHYTHFPVVEQFLWHSIF